MTRRTPRFGELAAEVEQRLEQLGILVDPNEIDADLRERIGALAKSQGVSPRTALRYATNDIADEVARAFVLLAKELMGRNWPGVAQPERRRDHLRVVK